jgi:uncharacterized protein (DUF2141 family)
MRTAIRAGLAALLSVCGASRAADLTVEIEGLRNGTGQVLVGIYRPGDPFPKAGAAFRGTKVAAGTAGRPGPLQVRFADLPEGTYALALVHDENANSTLDKDLVGRPKEGYGFSRDPALGFGPPAFESAAVAVGPKTPPLRVRMRY